MQLEVNENVGSINKKQLFQEEVKGNASSKSPSKDLSVAPQGEDLKTHLLKG